MNPKANVQNNSVVFLFPMGGGQSFSVFLVAFIPVLYVCEQLETDKMKLVNF